MITATISWKGLFGGVSTAQFLSTRDAIRWLKKESRPGCVCVLQYENGKKKEWKGEKKNDN